MSHRIIAAHGPVNCRDCWNDTESGNEYTTDDNRFRVVNDPGAWGAAEPVILVLGISKGFTQAREFSSGDFDRVPFKNCRERLKQVLTTVGVMAPVVDIDAAMSADEQEFGWGSLVRCSLSGWNKRTLAFGAGTPEVLPAFRHREARRFLTGCMDRFLRDLPDSVKLVCLLGNDDRYVAILADELKRLYGDDYSRINKIAHMVGGVPWVHLAHPSKGNGFFGRFISGSSEEGQGLKRELARDAVNLASF